jgi:hypothetical protein
MHDVKIAMLQPNIFTSTTVAKTANCVVKFVTPYFHQTAFVKKARPDIGAHTVEERFIGGKRMMPAPSLSAVITHALTCSTSTHLAVLFSKS